MRLPGIWRCQSPLGGIIVEKISFQRFGRKCEQLECCLRNTNSHCVVLCSLLKSQQRIVQASLQAADVSTGCRYKKVISVEQGMDSWFRTQDVNKVVYH
ncbi:hypothetical protein TNCT_731621 [Trichonephila clavata]|uniref:Uncharacterized protein n=1 Tax=Trichonephila clavata TaxID=2740835 RepID=A0A8X6J7N1_TRICU|nr:hypothetical protein TNCT_731621 [Trichonephila clavata]